MTAQLPDYKELEEEHVVAESCALAPEEIGTEDATGGAASGAGASDAVGAGAAASAGQGNYVALSSTGFRDFYLKPQLIRALSDAGFEHPSEIQHEAIPTAITRCDLLCQAKSGMGKTAIFVLALLHQLNPESADFKPGVHALVIAHTRELVVQIRQEFDRFSKHMTGMRTESVFGGVPMTKDTAMLAKPPTILIGTPGRLLALLRAKKLDPSNIEHFVLDECDKCLEKLDMRQDIQEIFRQTPRQKQVMMYTATMSEEVRAVCKRFMQKPVEIRVDDETKLTLHGLQQFYVTSEEKMKNRKLVELLDKLEFHQVIIFVSSTERANLLDKVLNHLKFPSLALHGNLSQDVRLESFNKIKEFKTRIVVATDLMGRGIDIERVNVVINYDMAASADSYLHRVGRAGRFGTKGLAVSFISSTEDTTVLNDVQSRFEVSIPEMPETIDASTYMNH